MDALKVAQIAPLFESIPPQAYGGTERIISFLTEELVRRGHKVTLFASGDSKSSAKLQAACERSLRNAGLSRSSAPLRYALLSTAYEHATDFDIIHAHVDFWSFPFARLVKIPTVTTMHGRLDVPDLRNIYGHYRDLPLVSISDSQREPMPGMNWVANIYHGVPMDLFLFNPKGGDYLAFLGRISPEKRPDLAIDVARAAGIPLKIAAKIDPVDREYYSEVIEPKLHGDGVEFVGEINEQEKGRFLGNALALLFTIDWPEPFGLVMIEAMACGTPVIARPCGSVPEVIRNGVTGLIAANFEELVDSCHRVRELSRTQCRREFEQRFSVDAMVDQYEELYRALICDSRARRGNVRSG